MFNHVVVASEPNLLVELAIGQIKLSTDGLKDCVPHGRIRNDRALHRSVGLWCADARCDRSGKIGETILECTEVLSVRLHRVDENIEQLLARENRGVASVGVVRHKLGRQHNLLVGVFCFLAINAAILQDQENEGEDVGERDCIEGSLLSQRSQAVQKSCNEVTEGFRKQILW